MRAFAPSCRLRGQPFLIALWVAAAASVCAQATVQPGPPNGNTATIRGTVKSTDGAMYEGARVELQLNEGPPESSETDSNGAFIFNNLPAGKFRLIVSSVGFQTQLIAGVLAEAQVYEVSPITLPVANADTVIRVSAESQQELAQEQLNVEEKQRVLGVIPNYYVSYDRNAVPLTAHQKFQLAWKTEIDPVTWAFTGVIAGIEQADNSLSGYGQGAQGYAKRFGANYTTGFIAAMAGNAILPSWFKQDPRYFYKGRGSVTSRALYAIANSVVCKGDNGNWQPAYSAILGGLGAGGIANLYYPANDRSGVTLTFENLGIGIAETAAENLFQEFVVRKFTPRLRRLPATNPAPVSR